MSNLTKRLTAMLLSGMLVIGSTSGSVFAADVQEDPGQTSAMAVEEAAADEVTEESVDEAETSEVISEEEAADESASADGAINGEASKNEEEALGETPEEIEAESAQETNKEDDEAAISEDTEKEDAGTDYVENIEEETPKTVDSVETVEEISYPIEETEEEEPAEETEEEDVASDMAESDNTETVPEQEEDIQTGIDAQDAADEQDAMEGLEAADEEYDLTGTEAPEETETISSDAMMEVVSSGTCGDNLTWTLDDEGTLTISGSGQMSNYDCNDSAPWYSSRSSIKTVIIEEGVTSIGNCAFEDCSSLASITIPKGVTGMGDYTFDGCNNLKCITIQEGVTEIGEGVFIGCSNLESITIPESVTSIGGSAFYGCSNLESITIPKSVISIGNGAFNECGGLTAILVDVNNTMYSSTNGVLFDKQQSIIIQYPSGKSDSNYSLPESVTEIGDHALSSCDNLLKVSLPESVTCIGEYAFNECSSLADISIPNNVTSIGRGAFFGCKNLSIITIPERVTSIGEFAFTECSSLTGIFVDSFNTMFSSVDGVLYDKQQSEIIQYPNGKSDNNYTLPESVTTVGDGSFCCNRKLKSIKLSGNVKTIGYNAFQDCNSLEDVSISDKMVHVYMFAFSGCSGLTDVYYSGSKEKWNLIRFDFGNEELINATIHYDVDMRQEIGSATVSELSEKTFTGEPITQNFTVVVDSITLKPDTDYTVAYSNNINVGTATVTITGMGNYTGTVTATFQINAASITTATVTGLSAKTYTGKAITQTPTVKIGTTTLKANTDYTVSYTNNTNAGTATVKITGKGNYTGTKTATFTINKAAQSITAKSSAASVAVGKTSIVSITGAKGTKSYKSSNTAVATVTSAGKVTAKKVGAVTITATSAATANYKAASKTVRIMVVPAATTSLTAANQVTGIKLSWSKVTGANGYMVYRGSTLVKTVTSGSTVTYTDTAANTNGTKYTFKIVAKAATGDSTLSKSVVAYRVARPAISSSTNSAAGKMTVKWAKNAKATGYQIQYSTSSTFASGNKAVSVTSASTVSKFIGSLTKGKTYYVRIRTYKTVGSTKYWSAWSVAKTVKITK